MNRVKHVSRFNQGVNGDISIKDLSPSTYRSAKNFSLMTQGKYGDLSVIKGTLLRTPMFDVIGDDFTVLNQTYSWGNVDPFCSGNYTQKRGIVYFTYDSDNRSNIIFFTPDDNQVYPIFPNPVDRNLNELGWSASSEVDFQIYSDKECHQVYFVDGDNYRKVEIKQSGTSCATYPILKQLTGRPLAPIDCLTSELDTGGALLSGGYQFLYRYYNTENCSYSAWSNITNTLRVIPDTDCQADAYGGAVGQSTDKKAKLTIVGSLGASGFDAAQVLVIPIVDGASTDPSNGIILPPDTDFYTNGFTYYNGNEEGVTIDLADVLVDGLPVLGGKTLTEKDGYMFIGGPKLNGFDFDNGDIEIEASYTIKQNVGNISDGDIYKCSTNPVGYMRSEQYPFGIFIYDKHRNGVVCPFDLSPFVADAVWKQSYSTGSTTGFISGETEVTVPDSSLFAVGDRISLNGDRGNVTQINGSVLTIDEVLSNATNGTINLLYGQSGNQNPNWAWTFAARSDNQFTIFDTDGNAQAIGLKIEGIKNFPTWAKGFEIVRRKRIKNVLYQIPHVPTITVQGAPSISEDLTPEKVYDYQGELDHMYIKNHRLGTARNIHVPVANQEAVIGPRPSWWPQTLESGKEEISSLLFAPAPEYLYNNGSGSFDLRDSAGGKIKIVDAVALRQDLKFNGPSHFAPELGTLVNRYATVYRATERGQYLYNREGRLVENGQDVFLKKIPELEGFINTVASDNIDIDYQLEIPNASPKITLPRPPMSANDYSHIVVYGATGELALQQASTSYVPGTRTAFFYGEVTNQKGLLLKIEDKLQDFSTIMAERANVNGDDYFPLIPDAYNPNIYDPSYLEREFIDDDGAGGTFTVYANTNNTGAVANGEIACGAYILNVVKGLGPDRYGDVSDGGEWIATGVCQPLTDEDLRLNTAFDVEIFGGDTFISKHSLKVNESTPRISEFDPIDAEIVSGVGQNDHAKTGAYEKNIEILEIYLESEVNSANQRVIDQFPAVENTKLATYAGTWNYYYHSGYSLQNQLKTYVGKQDFCKDVSVYRHGTIWSDKRVRGTSSVWSTDIEGFNNFKVNNIWLLDGKYGDISFIDTLDDKALHIFQERKIAFQPIGVDEIRTQDSALIAVGSGTVLGSGDYYLQADVGSQHFRSIVQWDGKFYGIDANRKTAFCFGSRGAGFEFISHKGKDLDFQELLSSEVAVNDLLGHIDPVHNRYIIHLNSNGRSEGSIFNIKSRSWEGDIDIKTLAAGRGEDGLLFWVNEGNIYEAYKGDPLSFFGDYENAEFEVVINHMDEQVKVFQDIAVNGLNRITYMVATVFNENLSQPDLVTNQLSLNKNPRNHQYHQNLLRAVINGRSVKLKGQVMVIKFVVEGGSNEEVIVNSIVTSMRKSK